MRSLIRERLRNCSTNIVHQVYRQIFSLFVTWILFLTPYQIQVYVIWALWVGLNFFFFSFFTIVTCTHIICSKVNSPTHLFYFSLNVLKLYMRWNCLQQNETGLFYWKRRKDILIKTSHNFINSYIKKIDNLIFFIILCLSSNIWFIENIARYTHREGMWFLELLSPL